VRYSTEKLYVLLAQRIADGLVVGFFQGRAEFGPRALGARSIFADPRSPQMQQQLNLKIKFRESFRPFAPCVLAERAADYFDLTAPSPYMLLTAPVTERRRKAVSASTSDSSTLLDRAHETRSDIPAVTHVDFSSRVQTVDGQENPALHALLTAFDQLTGCPVLINTSFNVRGEPPVGHPRDAIACFRDTEIDVLALGPYVVEKTALGPPLSSTQGRRVFAAD
jgi:carbamoyltransferase